MPKNIFTDKQLEYINEQKALITDEILKAFSIDKDSTIDTYSMASRIFTKHILLKLQHFFI